MAQAGFGDVVGTRTAVPPSIAPRQVGPAQFGPGQSDPTNTNNGATDTTYDPDGDVVMADIEDLGAIMDVMHHVHQNRFQEQFCGHEAIARVKSNTNPPIKLFQKKLTRNSSLLKSVPTESPTPPLSLSLIHPSFYPTYVSSMNLSTNLRVIIPSSPFRGLLSRS